MVNIETPTSWPFPPTGIGAFALKQQLRSFRSDVAELTVSTGNAADRIADVLKRLRSQHDVDPHGSEAAGSHGSESSTTMQDHSFARFISHDSTHMLSSEAIRARSRTAVNPTYSPTLVVKGNHERLASPTDDAPSTSTKLEAPYRSTYEQCRAFLSVTASIKDDAARAQECNIVEAGIAPVALLQIL